MFAKRRNLLSRVFGREEKPDIKSNKPAPLKKLIEQVARTQEQSYDCDEVFQLLDQYVELVEDNQDAEVLMPLVKQHLELCPDCREEFEGLLKALRASAE